VSDSSEGGPGKSDLAERQATLEAFARAIDHEAHVLSERPDLLWQQLYNRLQWEEEPALGVLAPGLALPHPSRSPIRSAGLNRSWARAAFSAS
jgi:hypothetical protein